jgi:predicted DNA-binding protein with PD1-like motif
MAGQETQKPVGLKVLAVRLEPGADLKASLDELARRHRIEAGCVVSCVGSLRVAVLRLASGTVTRAYRRKLEIVSLVGTLSASSGSHLHASLADSRGACIGGHLKEGSIVFTTAEVVVGILEGTRFSREPDEATGWKELVIGQRSAKALTRPARSAPRRARSRRS